MLEIFPDVTKTKVADVKELRELDNFPTCLQANLAFCVGRTFSFSATVLEYILEPS